VDGSYVFVFDILACSVSISFAVQTCLISHSKMCDIFVFYSVILSEYCYCLHSSTIKNKLQWWAIL